MLSFFAVLRGSSFRRQLSVAVTGVVLPLAILSSLATSWQGSREIRETMRKQGIRIAENLAGQSRLALLTQSPDNVAEAISGTLAFPDVVRVEIRRPDGSALVAKDRNSVLASSHDESKHLATMPEAAMEKETGNDWHFVAPVLTAASDSPFLAEDTLQQTLGYVRVVESKDSLTRAIAGLVVINLGISVIFGVVFLLVIRWLTQRLTQPLAKLADAMGRAESGMVGVRAELGGAQDIIKMAHAFNSMIEVLEQRERDITELNASLENRVRQRSFELERANNELTTTLETLRHTQHDLIRVEKMASLGSMVAGIAHELNTPIGNSVMVASTLQERAQVMLQEVRSGQVRRSVLDDSLAASALGAEILVRNLHRAADLITSFKQVAVDQSSNHRREFDLRQTLEEVIVTLQPLYKKTPYHLNLDLAPDIVMDSYPGALGQIITNFITNAVAHAFEGREHGSMNIVTRPLPDAQVEISFSDDGIGIAKENLERVFDPFFTTKLGRGGSGLGMHIVYNLTKGVLGGKIALNSQVGSGTTVSLTLPLCAPDMSDKAGVAES